MKTTHSLSYQTKTIWYIVHPDITEVVEKNILNSTLNPGISRNSVVYIFVFF